MEGRDVMRRCSRSVQVEATQVDSDGEMLLDDMDTVELLLEALTCLAQAKVPSDVTEALMGAGLTALAKPDGGVRGIATGSSLRRLVARILARQFMQEFESECAPFQYALSTRAGTDCVGHFLRAATDDNPRATILSVDGVRASDHVLRLAMLERLLHMPKARAILPFVRLSYGSPSMYSWEDDIGTQWKVTQAEGGEQGDPLMPLLFSIAIHAALEELASHLEDGEQLCAFLDDVYVLCLPHRVVPLFKVLRESLDRVAGIRLHEGKTKVWNRSGTAPEDIEELGGGMAARRFEGSWHAQWVSNVHRRTVARTSGRCAWQLLLQSANTRANHTLRTFPPSLSGRYTQDHNDGTWATVEAFLQQVPGEVEEHNLRARSPLCQ